jgi:putative transposase
MSRYRRSRTTGATYFFTLTTYRRRKLLTHPVVRQALHEAILTVRRKLPFTSHAWVLLPDHLHTLWEMPDGDSDYGLRWSLIKQHASRMTLQGTTIDITRSQSQRNRRESGFWQRRFWEHLIRDEEDFARHMDYIHWNPVKHGYVSQAKNWPYSTFHRLVRDGVYPADWGGADNKSCQDEFGE